MSERTERTTVGALPDTTAASSHVPAALTWLVWALFAASIGVLALRVRSGGDWTFPGVVTVDGLTVTMWVVVTVFSGVVHSYSRRYMAGSAHGTRFFATVFGFTVAVLALVAADHVALFGLAWLVMGLLMAELVGVVRGWKQARAAARIARTYFLASSALLGVALAALWWATGETTVSGIAAAADTLGGAAWLVAAGALVLAAMIQSALLPFHGWLLSSMTAPTPASALMHAGFVNAGGILLVRFAPVVTVDPALMLAVVAVGAASAIGGKLLKSVRPDVKSRLGCSTVGQMGFMIMQAGLGFFGAAITHLALHGCYKAYLFLSAGEEVEHTSPGHTRYAPAEAGPVASAVTVLTALAGGVVFAALTGKGTDLDAGLLLTGLVVLTTMHATWAAVRSRGVPASVRYGVVAAVFLPAIAVYAAAYNLITGLTSGAGIVTAPAELTVAHGVLAAAFLGTYVAIETGAYRYSDRLYVTLVNATHQPSGTLLTSGGEYDDH
jgi:NAD(P)H-quinone oxidoreductase subunit 5